MSMSALFCCFRPKSHVEALSDATKELKKQMIDVYQRIYKAESEGRAFTYEVRLWLQAVDVVEDQVKKIEHDYLQAGCFGAPFTRSRAIKTLASVKELMSKGGGFDLEEPKILKSVHVESSTFQAVGMEPYLEIVRRHLEDDGVGVIGIYGMGGVGKTTLMRIINNTFLQESTQYDVVIWATISMDFNLIRLQQDIARRLNLELPEYASTQTHAAAIFGVLEDKNFVLMLDDIWERMDLQDVGIPITGRSTTGSLPLYKRKVIFTTRSQEVCYIMEANSIIKIEVLEPEAAWSLFKSQAGEAMISSNPVIANLAKELVKECHGLPLALSTMGRSMSNKHDIREWEVAVTMMRDSRLSHFPGMTDTLFRVLKLDYDHLQSDTLRNCFLTCSLWPDDCQIEVDELIKCWMGMGLLGGFYFKVDRAFSEGYVIINILKSACLLEDGEGGDNKYVKMHSVMRDLALWIASDCGKNEGRWMVRAGHELKEAGEGERWRNTERVSLINNTLESLPETLPECPNLASLTLEGNHPLKSIPFSFFRSMPALVFLDLSNTNIQQLPPEIQMLAKLQHLNLSHTPIPSLPEALGDLQSLKYLHLTGTKHLTKIAPKIIPRLSNLLLLDLYRSQYNFWELEELKYLSKCLEALGITISTITAFQNITTSLHLPLWRLSISQLKSDNYLVLSGSYLDGLEELCIEHCMNVEELIHECEVGESSQHSLVSLARLKRVRFHFLPRLKYISWSQMNLHMLLPSLRFLEFEWCERLKNLSWVLQLQYIEEIILSYCMQLEQVVEDEVQVRGDFTPFLFLKKLRLRNLPRLRNFCASSIEFPSLQSVEVIGCPHLEKKPSNNAGHVKNLKLDNLH